MALKSFVATLLIAIGSAQDTLIPPWVQSEYNTSPAVLPSPNETGTGWEQAFKQASAFVAQLTTAEKIGLVGGVGGICEGQTAAIPRLNFSGYCLQDGPLGIRFSDYVSVFPAGVTVAASWDRTLTNIRGLQIGAEFRAKGAHVMLGPVAGPLGRSPYDGRDYEGFSPDPYLTGHLFALTIQGVQTSGTQACGKHFIGNEQETQRTSSTDAEGQTINAVSSNIDDRTMHELYLWPFQDGVKAGMTSLMCSYNRINGTYACQNSKTINGLLKEELGYQGYVVSDWGATHSSAPGVLAGQDMDMPGNTSIVISGETIPFTGYFEDYLPAEIKNGTVSMARLEDMGRRIMTPYFLLNQSSLPPAQVNPTILNSGYLADHPNYTIAEQGPERDVREDHASLIRTLGAAGIVLLKNLNNTLPLKKPKDIAVLGNDAGPPLNGVRLELDALGALGNPEGFEYGTLATGPPQEYGTLITPLQGIQQRAALQGNNPIVQYVLNNTFILTGGLTALVPANPDVCIVFLKSWGQEGLDKTELYVDWNGTEVVETVAASCPNTVVVTHSGGLNVLPFANNTNVTAILAAHWGGDQQGNSIADVLWGDYNPSGHLPYTVPIQQSDYNFVEPTRSVANTTDPNAWESDFKEGLLIDYRHFDYYNLPVQYEFGYGLSYTTFALSSLSASWVGGSQFTARPAAQAVVPGGNPNLWQPTYQVTVKVQNTGKVAGSAVPQLYLGLPPPPNNGTTPVKVLRGFEKILLLPGQSETVTFTLSRRDISSWDIISQNWVVSAGAIKLSAGFSSRDIRATSSVVPKLSGTH